MELGRINKTVGRINGIMPNFSGRLIQSSINFSLKEFTLLLIKRFRKYKVWSVANEIKE